MFPLQTTSDDQSRNACLRPFDTHFRAAVDLHASRTALAQDDRVWDYRKLDDIATRIASHLVSIGVSPGDCVGICMPRSPEAIAAMLGIHRAGAAFVPLDSDYPVDRIEYMVSDAEIRFAFCQGSEERSILQQIQHNVEGGLHTVDVSDALVESGLASDLPDIQPEDLAYVMYTSGSTGKPKGVEIDHAALTAYCLADAEVYQLTKHDRTLQFSTLNFDIAIEEIFPPLMTGGAVVVRPSTRSQQHNELSDLITTHQITAIHLATAFWHEWVDLIAKSGDRVPDSIRLMVVTGEKVSVEHYKRWNQRGGEGTLWCNAYGPTEATVTATVYIPEEGFQADHMPIGRPLPGYTARILNDEMQEVSPGESGELCIGGPALARGYLNRQDLTEAAFIMWDGRQVAHQDANEPATPERLYRTGDIARWLDDGNIEFGGRKDHQIKLGSYRIEPAEIEAILNQHPSVDESLVKHDEAGGQKFLVAYLAGTVDSSEAADVSEWLRDRLPPYMIPHRYVMMPRFPKTINGKIERDALPSPSESVVARRKDYVAPRTDLENQLADLWKETLNLPEVGIHDDFFHLGGSSLLVTRVVAELSQHWSLELPVRDFFANPTVAMMATHLEALRGGNNQEPKEAANLGFRATLPNIQPGYFRSGSEDAFYVHYPPVGHVDSRHGVVLCSSYGHEQSRCQRNLQQMAVILAKNGFDVLRFDYTYTGQSTGACEGLSAQSMLRNVEDACEWLRRRTSYEKLSLLGVRVGATLASLAQVGKLHSRLLWDPVLDGKSYVELLTRLHERSLNGLVRFARKRKGLPGQAFGYPLSQQKEEGFSTLLRLPQGKPESNEQRKVLVSQDYLSQESDPDQSLRNWEVVNLEDEILWHSGRHTESAFSSPDVYRKVLQCLRQNSPMGDELNGEVTE